MSEQQQPNEQHCDHECVCMGYCNRNEMFVDDPCTKKPCEHDTRSRPHPAPTQFKCPDCERTFDSDIHLGIHHYADHAIKHDATIARQAREQVLQDLLYNIDSETGFYVFPHPKSNAGNGLSRFVLLDDLTTLVESLRSTQQQAGEP